MSWDFETEPEFQKELDWITAFVREEVEPLDHILGNPYDIQNPRNRKIVPKLQEQGQAARPMGLSPGDRNWAAPATANSSSPS